MLDEKVSCVVIYIEYHVCHLFWLQRRQISSVQSTFENPLSIEASGWMIGLLSFTKNLWVGKTISLWNLDDLSGTIEPKQTKRGNIGYIINDKHPSPEKYVLQTSDVFDEKQNKMADNTKISLTFPD